MRTEAAQNGRRSVVRLDAARGPNGAASGRQLRLGLARKLAGIVRLTRFENCVLACGATMIGAASAGPGLSTDEHGVLGGVIVAVVVAFGNVVNDVVDEEVDRCSKPLRPMPAGTISRRFATALAGVLATVAVALTAALAPRLLVFVAVMLALALVYSIHLERLPAIGNLAVATQTGAVFLFGALGAGRVTGLTVAGTVLIGGHSLGVELAKTMEDRDADGLVGARTIAHVLTAGGQQVALLGVLTAFAAATIVFGVTLDAPAAYWLVLVPAVPLAALCFAGAGADGSEARPARIGAFIRVSKTLWLVGLAGLALTAA